MNIVYGCEAIAELLIYAIVVFGPWAFGTTQAWSIWVVNGMAYALGLTSLGAKAAGRMVSYRAIRRHDPAHSDCWDGSPKKAGLAFANTAARTETLNRWFRIGLKTLTAALLGYCFASAINSRAVYLPAEERFEYHDCIVWLPHSFDETGTWRAFRTYLAMACLFWAVHRWLLGKTSSELKRTCGPRSAKAKNASPFPARLGRLLWVLCINGGLLAVEAIIQRQVHSPKLLFVVQPQVHRQALSQLGPFAYRANGAQYLNLIWPVCLGFWWTLSGQGPRRKRHLVLPVCATLMAAGAIMSTSRGGALVTCALLLASAAIFLGDRSRVSPVSNGNGRTALWLCLLGGPVLGLFFGWAALKPRLATLRQGFEDRARICSLAEPIAKDHTVYGTGPGTYEAVSELYRPGDADFWPAQVHNDWLEIRITFGWMGCSLLALAGSLVICRTFLPGGLRAGNILIILAWLASAGCLLHARFDFPLQVHSILSLFAVLAAVLFTLSYGRLWLH